MNVFLWILFAACRALGMEHYNISDSQITASSEFDGNHATRNARLNFDPGCGPVAASWSAAFGDFDVRQSWLQVDFIERVTITKVATQGRRVIINSPSPSCFNSRHYQWVTTYSLNYSQDGVDFIAYEQSGNVKVIFVVATFSLVSVKRQLDVGVSAYHAGFFQQIKAKRTQTGVKLTAMKLFS